MNYDKRFPHVPKELLEELEKRFPDRVPDIKDCHQEAFGAVKVIRFLRAQFNLQQSNILEN